MSAQQTTTRVKRKKPSSDKPSNDKGLSKENVNTQKNNSNNDMDVDVSLPPPKVVSNHSSDKVDDSVTSAKMVKISKIDEVKYNKYATRECPANLILTHKPIFTDHYIDPTLSLSKNEAANHFIPQFVPVFTRDGDKIPTSTPHNFEKRSRIDTDVTPVFANFSGIKEVSDVQLSVNEAPVSFVGVAIDRNMNYSVGSNNMSVATAGEVMMLCPYETCLNVTHGDLVTWENRESNTKYPLEGGFAPAKIVKYNRTNDDYSSIIKNFDIAIKYLNGRKDGYYINVLTVAGFFKNGKKDDIRLIETDFKKFLSEYRTYTLVKIYKSIMNGTMCSELPFHDHTQFNYFLYSYEVTSILILLSRMKYRVGYIEQSALKLMKDVFGSFITLSYLKDDVLEFKDIYIPFFIEHGVSLLSLKSEISSHSDVSVFVPKDIIPAFFTHKSVRDEHSPVKIPNMPATGFPKLIFDVYYVFFDTKHKAVFLAYIEKQDDSWGVRLLSTADDLPETFKDLRESLLSGIIIEHDNTVYATISYSSVTDSNRSLTIEQYQRSMYEEFFHKRKYIGKIFDYIYDMPAGTDISENDERYASIRGGTSFGDIFNFNNSNIQYGNNTFIRLVGNIDVQKTKHVDGLSQIIKEQIDDYYKTSNITRPEEHNTLAHFGGTLNNKQNEPIAEVLKSCPDGGYLYVKIGPFGTITKDHVDSHSQYERGRTDEILYKRHFGRDIRINCCVNPILVMDNEEVTDSKYWTIRAGDPVFTCDDVECLQDFILPVFSCVEGLKDLWKSKTPPKFVGVAADRCDGKMNGYNPITIIAGGHVPINLDPFDVEDSNIGSLLAVDPFTPGVIVEDVGNQCPARVFPVSSEKNSANGMLVGKLTRRPKENQCVAQVYLAPEYPIEYDCVNV